MKKWVFTVSDWFVEEEGDAGDDSLGYTTLSGEKAQNALRIYDVDIVMDDRSL